MDGKIEIEIFRSWKGCRWCWYLWVNEESSLHGVEDAFELAVQAVQKAYDSIKEEIE